MTLTNETTSPDAIYTQVAGTTGYIKGERVTITRIGRRGGAVAYAYAALDERPGMLLIEFGRATQIQSGQPIWHEVIGSREIDRDEFDRLNHMDSVRHEMGWRS